MWASQTLMGQISAREIVCLLKQAFNRDIITLFMYNLTHAYSEALGFF